MTTIAVIDYGMGNLRSVSKALEHVAPKLNIKITSRAEDIEQAEKIVFPGVGAISHCMQELEQRQLTKIVTEAAAYKPFLGICVGMQALFTSAAENEGTQALDILPGSVPKLPVADLGVLSIPHMGWNNVKQTIDHPLWQNIENNARFYFVHSYYVKPDEPSLTCGACNYGIEFTAAICRGNIFATQFHPEKSQHDGLQLLENFSKWDGTC